MFIVDLTQGSRQGLPNASFRIGVRQPMSFEADLYFISVAARMLGMHPQTLRKYERLGLVQPSRTIGSMRLYSREELDRLKAIKHLVSQVFHFRDLAVHPGSKLREAVHRPDLNVGLDWHFTISAARTRSTQRH